MRNRLQSNQPPEQQQIPESTEFKVKTLEEIRAEKLARCQSPKESSAIGDVTSPSPSSKRPAPPSNKQVRIKRLKESSDVDHCVQVPTPKQPVTNPVVTNSSLPDSTETDDFLDDDVDEDGQANAGSLNDDELLLEIDNILGD